LNFSYKFILKRDTLEVSVLANKGRFGEVVLVVVGCFSPSAHRRRIDTEHDEQNFRIKGLTHVSIARQNTL